MRDIQHAALQRDSYRAPSIQARVLESLSLLVTPKIDQALLPSNTPETSARALTPEAQARTNSKISALITKNIATEVGCLVGLGSLLISGWLSVIEHHTPIIAGACAALSVAGYLYNSSNPSRFLKQITSSPCPPECEALRERAQAIVDELAPSFELAPPRIVIHKEGAFAMLVHGPERPHTIALAPFCDQLDQPQLTAILAHEIAHCNRPQPFIDRMNECLLWLALPAASVTFAEFAVSFATQLMGAPLANLAATTTAIWCSIVLHDALDFASKYMLRNHELATDLRAILATGDPEGFLKALETTWQSMSDRSKTAYETERSCHPSFARRTNTIKEACGIDTHIESTRN